MKSSHLTVAAFCHVLLASIVFYFTSTTNVQASPLSTIDDQLLKSKPAQHIVHPPAVEVAAPATHQHQAAVDPIVQHVQARSGAPAPQVAAAASASAVAPAVFSKEPVVQKSSSVPVEQPLVLTERKLIVPLKDSSKPELAEVKPAMAAASKPMDEPTLQAKSAAAMAAGHEKAKIGDAKKIEAAVSEPQMVKESSIGAKSAALAEIVPKPEQAIVAPPAAAPTPIVSEKIAPHQQVSEIPQPQAAALVAAPTQVEESKPEVVVVRSVVKPVPVVVAAEPMVKQVVEAPIAASPSVPSVVQAAPSSEPQRETIKSAVVEPAVVEGKPAVVVEQQQQQAAPAPLAVETKAPTVMGGLGPLHLLATTLCSYQPDKLVADEHLNQLYARRASVRKSLFEFMSLKFTNLEKLSSRLGYGLQVVPVKLLPVESGINKATPSHGWPVVGKCTAYDLKLMGEAAWCECHEGDLGCPSSKPSSDKLPAASAVVVEEQQPAKITSNQHAVAVSKMARSISTIDSFLPSPEESSVISKLLHVNDIKDAPSVESTIYSLNLTQNQLATLEAHATSTQECRRNALRYSKALFNHLAEDQREVSESWPRLYALISSDDCARKRMIDIFNALSSFRTDTTSIRRDNLEFAFAMDDLRAKVLESEVNVPLTFDRHFIEVEQFLQQSVRLMLANIQPKRAKLTSMRYRSLMYGASPQAADDQCIDLHQRLLARNYPNDCNPTQFGQLPDSLRMTASSLELWSIEKELSLEMAKVTDYPNSSGVGQQKVKENVNECIANLVSS